MPRPQSEIKIRFTMCLWTVQWCEICNRTSYLYTHTTCENVSCKRHPLHSTTEANFVLVHFGPCPGICQFDDCGLILRRAACGDGDALYDYCQSDSESDESSQ